MNPFLPRFLKVAYRKEPISSFVLIVGLVDVVIGGVGTEWSLLSLGVFTALLAVSLRWWQTQKSAVIAVEPKPRRYLPPARPPLPILTQEHRQR